ncbi:carboxymuconolactone decarboxylase family protein [Tsuneonella sp. HG222]
MNLSIALKNQTSRQIDVKIKEKNMSETRYERGLALRKDILGADYVEASFRNSDEFSRPIQELSTEYCWGEIWSRPGLARRERSLLNIGMISALNRPHELKLHIKAALTNGLSRDEIREALLQVAIYCGMPAGLDSTRIAREAFAEVDAAT